MPTSPKASGFPALVSNFRVQVGRTPVALSSVSALFDSISEKLADRPTNDANLPPKPTVVLGRAVTQDHFLYNWFRDTRLGKDTRADVTVILLDGPDGDEINRWLLRNAHPIKWTGPLFEALGNELVMEELELVYDFVDWPDAKGETE